LAQQLHIRARLGNISPRLVARFDQQLRLSDPARDGRSVHSKFYPWVMAAVEKLSWPNRPTLFRELCASFATLVARQARAGADVTTHSIVLANSVRKLRLDVNHLVVLLQPYILYDIPESVGMVPALVAALLDGLRTKASALTRKVEYAMKIKDKTSRVRSVDHALNDAAEFIHAATKLCQVAAVYQTTPDATLNKAVLEVARMLLPVMKSAGQLATIKGGRPSENWHYPYWALMRKTERPARFQHYAPPRTCAALAEALALCFGSTLQGNNMQPEESNVVIAVFEALANRMVALVSDKNQQAQVPPAAAAKFLLAMSVAGQHVPTVFGILGRHLLTCLRDPTVRNQFSSVTFVSVVRAFYIAKFRLPRLFSELADLAVQANGNSFGGAGTADILLARRSPNNTTLLKYYAGPRIFGAAAPLAGKLPVTVDIGSTLPAATVDTRRDTFMAAWKRTGLPVHLGGLTTDVGEGEGNGGEHEHEPSTTTRATAHPTSIQLSKLPTRHLRMVQEAYVALAIPHELLQCALSTELHKRRDGVNMSVRLNTRS
jgi:hypothetical protein